MLNRSTRERLMASTIILGAAFAVSVGSAQAQGTATAQPGTISTETTQSAGQATPGTTVTPEAQGVKAVAPVAQVGEVVVTGSRIARRDYVSDSPIVSVGPKALEATGDITLERVIQQLPQVVGVNGSQVNNGGNGQVNVDLRGVGASRTLVLVDGRRITPSNASGVVDLNTIPQALIESVEIITGGASSSYGSDAVTGVVNFKLKKNFQGLVIDGQYNTTERGDGEETGFSATAGGKFADDRGHAVLSFGYTNRRPVFYGDRPEITTPDFRDFGLTDPRILAVGGLSGTLPQGGAAAFANNTLNAAALNGIATQGTPNVPGANVTGANAFTQTAVNAVFAKYGVAAGTVAVNQNTAFGFNSDGTLFFKGVNYKGPTDLDFSTIPNTVAGNGPGLYNTGALNYALTPQTRYNIYSSASYKITPHIEAYGQAIFTQYQANTVLAPTPAANSPATAFNARNTVSTGFLVPANNKFIPADLKTLLNSRPNPNAPFQFNKRFTEFGARNAEIQYTTYQILTGLRGDLPGDHDLTYDIFATYGRTIRDDIQSGNLNRSAFRQYLENGSLGGCTDYNPFGQNGISAACLSALSPTTKDFREYTQRQAEASLQGRAFTIPSLFNAIGGEARFVLGADYRQDRFRFIPDAIASSKDTSGTVGSATNPYNNSVGLAGFNAASPLQGVIDVYELFGEGLIPIVHDLPGFQRVNLNIGARYSNFNFSSQGQETLRDTTTYKADLEWKVNDFIFIRGGYARAVRAPNVGDLYTPLQTNFAAIGNPTGLGSGDPCDINGAYRKGRGVDAAAVRALCVSQGIPASAVDTYQQANQQAPTTSGGNPNLSPERANTYSGGVVLTSKFSNPLFSRMSLSLDYYNISIQGYITGIPFSTSLSKCFNADGSNPTYTNNNLFCNNIVRDPGSGQVVNGFANSQNSGGLKTSGIDLQFDWSFPLSSLPVMHLSDDLGRLSFNVVGSWLNDFDFRATTTDKYLQFRDTIASQGYYPVWKGLFGATYSVGRFDFGVTERYLGEAADSSCIGLTVECTARGVTPTFYTNLTARWRINDIIEARFGVDNATDQAPRFFDSGSSSQAFTDSSTYDLIGRRYYVGLKARF